jgi:tRNA nucleotidyltransferase (CCA-adding enzyme)
MNFSKSDIPSGVLHLINLLHDRGYEGWLVGGAIRTLLLGKVPNDWDVTTNATPEQVQGIFQHTIETGLAYGTVTVVMDHLQIQVTTFRKESEYENHRKPKEVSFCNTIEEDLSRRDFTMNSIAFDSTTDEFRDPFEGQKDIQQQWIKAVGDPTIRFKEDALRILRAIRFQSQLGFSIDGLTLQAMEDDANLLSSLSRERIHQEFNKWLMGDHFSMTKETAQKIKFESWFEFGPSGEFYGLWDRIGSAPTGLLFRLCAFFDLYTGPITPQDKIDNSLKLLKSLKYSQNTISKVIQFIEFLSTPLDCDVLTDRLHLVRMALQIGFEHSILLLDWKLQHSPSKLMLLKAKNHLVVLRQNGFEGKVKPLALDGTRVIEFLKLQPGPEVKVALTRLEDYVLENPNQNTETDLLNFLKKS